MRTLVVLAALAGCRGKAPAPAPPAIAIELAYPGASAAVIETTAVMPIERGVAAIPGVTGVEARIDADKATLLVELDRDADVAMHEVHHAIANADLPSDIAPTLHATRRDDTPILWLALRGEAQPITELSAFARDEVVMRLLRVPGVAQVAEHGLATPTLVVWPDLAKLTAYGVSMFEVVAALQVTDAGTPSTFGELIIKPQVRLGDLARIELGFERTPGDPMLAVHARIDANRGAVLEAVRAELAHLQTPPGLTVTETKRDPPPPPALVATLFGNDLDELHRVADDAVKRLTAAGVRGVVVDPPVGQPEQTVDPDRRRMAALGVSSADLHATLRVIGAQRIGWTQMDGGRRPIVIKLPAMPLAEAADKLTVRAANGGLVPLAQLVDVKVGTAQAILRIRMQRAVRLAIPEDAETAKRVLHAPLPPGITLVP